MEKKKFSGCIYMSTVVWRKKCTSEAELLATFTYHALVHIVTSSGAWTWFFSDETELKAVVQELT